MNVGEYMDCLPGQVRRTTAELQLLGGLALDREGKRPMSGSRVGIDACLMPVRSEYQHGAEPKCCSWGSGCDIPEHLRLVHTHFVDAVSIFRANWSHALRRVTIAPIRDNLPPSEKPDGKEMLEKPSWI